MLRTGVFTDEKTAEEQVIQVLNFDIHLVKDFRGRRYIERVTECIPIEQKNEYIFEHKKDENINEKLDRFIDNTTKYFTKVTNKELYKYVNIMEYHNDEYVITNKISDQNIKEMRLNMSEDDIAEFDAFIERNWGKQEKVLAGVGVSDEDSKPIKRGRKPKNS